MNPLGNHNSHTDEQKKYHNCRNNDALKDGQHRVGSTVAYDSVTILVAILDDGLSEGS